VHRHGPAADVAAAGVGDGDLALEAAGPLVDVVERRRAAATAAAAGGGDGEDAGVARVAGGVGGPDPVPVGGVGRQAAVGVAVGRRGGDLGEVGAVAALAAVDLVVADRAGGRAPGQRHRRGGHVRRGRRAWGAGRLGAAAGGGDGEDAGVTGVAGGVGGPDPVAVGGVGRQAAV